jgi:hypothetical protein
MYTAETVCTIAELPDFKSMVITADLVFRRKIQKQNNVNTIGRFTSFQISIAYLIWNEIRFEQPKAPSGQGF